MIAVSNTESLTCIKLIHIETNERPIIIYMNSMSKYFGCVGVISPRPIVLQLSTAIKHKDQMNGSRIEPDDRMYGSE